MSHETAGRTIRLAFVFEEEYRRQQFLEGWALEEESVAICDIAKLSRAEREYLLSEVTADFREDQQLPLEWNLFVPFYDEKSRDVFPQPWQATVNPFTTSPEDIVRQWIEDYRTKKEDAEAKLSQS